VAPAGDVTEFRVTKREAEHVEATLLRLMNGPPSAPAALAASSGSLAQASELRDARVLSDGEFEEQEEQKARLLG
jgi:hypothetical protein